MAGVRLNHPVLNDMPRGMSIRHVEVEGFDSDNVLLYIETFFMNDQEKKSDTDKKASRVVVEKFRELLESDLRLLGLLTNPLVLCLVCILVKYGVAVEELRNIKKIEIYAKIEALVCEREGKDFNNERENLKLFHKFCLLMLLKNGGFFVKDMRNFGIDVESIPFISIGKKNVMSFNQGPQVLWPHRSFQEYSAAKYILECGETMRNGLLMYIASKRELNNTLNFITGLLELKGNDLKGVVNIVLALQAKLEQQNHLPFCKTLDNIKLAKFLSEMDIDTCIEKDLSNEFQRSLYTVKPCKECWRNSKYGSTTGAQPIINNALACFSNLLEDDERKHMFLKTIAHVLPKKFGEHGLALGVPDSDRKVKVVEEISGNVKMKANRASDLVTSKAFSVLAGKLLFQLELCLDQRDSICTDDVHTTTADECDKMLLEMIRNKPVMMEGKLIVTSPSDSTIDEMIPGILGMETHLSKLGIICVETSIREQSANLGDSVTMALKTGWRIQHEEECLFLIPNLQNIQFLVRYMPECLTLNAPMSNSSRKNARCQIQTAKTGQIRIMARHTSDFLTCKAFSVLAGKALGRLELFLDRSDRTTTNDNGAPMGENWKEVLEYLLRYSPHFNDGVLRIVMSHGYPKYVMKTSILLMHQQFLHCGIKLVEIQIQKDPKEKSLFLSLRPKSDGFYIMVPGTDLKVGLTEEEEETSKLIIKASKISDIISCGAFSYLNLETHYGDLEIRLDTAAACTDDANMWIKAFRDLNMQAPNIDGGSIIVKTNSALTKAHVIVAVSEKYYELAHHGIKYIEIDLARDSSILKRLKILADLGWQCTMNMQYLQMDAPDKCFTFVLGFVSEGFILDIPNSNHQVKLAEVSKSGKLNFTSMRSSDITKSGAFAVLDLKNFSEVEILVEGKRAGENNRETQEDWKEMLEDLMQNSTLFREAFVSITGSSEISSLIIPVMEMHHQLSKHGIVSMKVTVGDACFMLSIFEASVVLGWHISIDTGSIKLMSPNLTFTLFLRFGPDGIMLEVPESERRVRVMEANATNLLFMGDHTANMRKKGLALKVKACTKGMKSRKLIIKCHNVSDVETSGAPFLMNLDTYVELAVQPNIKSQAEGDASSAEEWRHFLKDIVENPRNSLVSPFEPGSKKLRAQGSDICHSIKELEATNLLITENASEISREVSFSVLKMETYVELKQQHEAYRSVEKKVESIIMQTPKLDEGSIIITTHLGVTDTAVTRVCNKHGLLSDLGIFTVYIELHLEDCFSETMLECIGHLYNSGWNELIDPLGNELIDPLGLQSPDKQVTLFLRIRPQENVHDLKPRSHIVRIKRASGMFCLTLSPENPEELHLGQNKQLQTKLKVGDQELEECRETPEALVFEAFHSWCIRWSEVLGAFLEQIITERNLSESNLIVNQFFGLCKATYTVAVRLLETNVEEEQKKDFDILRALEVFSLYRAKMVFGILPLSVNSPEKNFNLDLSFGPDTLFLEVPHTDHRVVVNGLHSTRLVITADRVSHVNVSGAFTILSLKTFEDLVVHLNELEEDISKMDDWRQAMVELMRNGPFSEGTYLRIISVSGVAPMLSIYEVHRQLSNNGIRGVELYSKSSISQIGAMFITRGWQKKEGYGITKMTSPEENFTVLLSFGPDTLFLEVPHTDHRVVVNGLHSTRLVITADKVSHVNVSGAFTILSLKTFEDLVVHLNELEEDISKMDDWRQAMVELMRNGPFSEGTYLRIISVSGVAPMLSIYEVHRQLSNNGIRGVELYSKSSISQIGAMFITRGWQKKEEKYGITKMISPEENFTVLLRYVNKELQLPIPGTTRTVFIRKTSSRTEIRSSRPSDIVQALCNPFCSVRDDCTLYISASELGEIFGGETHTPDEYEWRNLVFELLKNAPKMVGKGHLHIHSPPPHYNTLTPLVNAVCDMTGQLADVGVKVICFSSGRLMAADVERLIQRLEECWTLKSGKSDLEGMCAKLCWGDNKIMELTIRSITIEVSKVEAQAEEAREINTLIKNTGLCWDWHYNCDDESDGEYDDI